MQDVVRGATGVDLRQTDWKAIETEIKYDGYLEQQRRQIERLRRSDGQRIPPDFAYQGVPGLSHEIVERMERVRPATLGQASRIPGVTPAAVSILNVLLTAKRGSSG
jgi:tRNA uridine 5-carboxymethylaminomethyl modification enzyme